MNNPGFQGNAPFDGQLSSSSHPFPPPQNMPGRFPDQFSNPPGVMNSEMGMPNMIPNDIGGLEQFGNQQPFMGPQHNAPSQGPDNISHLQPQLSQQQLVRRFRCGACENDLLESDAFMHCQLGCKQFFHRQCTQLTDDAWEHLMRFMRSDIPVYPLAMWICNRCADNARIPPCIPLPPPVNAHVGPDAQFRR